jgi:hypothetical protein
MYENFRVRLRGKSMPQCTKPFAKLAIVIQLTVENDGHIACFIPNWLLAAGQIDDAQASHTESESRRSPIANQEAFAVRTAMTHRRGHHPYAFFRVTPFTQERDAADSAHAIT